jgi:hypothetical protein
VSDSNIRKSGAQRFTIKTLLVPLLTHPTAAKVIKYTVYGALVVNFFLYFIDDYNAFRQSLPDDAPLSDIFEQFSTTIDMAGWIGLVFFFELETYALPDEAFKGWVTKLLLIGRLVCYAGIGYAAYGYTAESLENYDVRERTDISNLCQIADQGTSVQLNAWQLEPITSENCESLSDESTFFQINSEVSVLAESTLMHNRAMGWVDVVNAIVWLIVVFLIEVEVWLQSKDRFSSRALTVARVGKTFFYLVLMANGVIWIFSGYPLYAWDAFLWIFGFWAIELNLAEWEIERTDELRGAAA